jgi:hypothetical protein
VLREAPYSHSLSIYNSATVSHELQNIFVLHIISLISEFKIPTRPLKMFFILKYVWRPNFIFFRILFFIFLRIKKSFLLKIINSMHFHPLKKYKILSPNIFQYGDTFSGRISVLNSKMGDTMRSKKKYFVLRD